MDSKSTLLYMTGLSIDKKRLNHITENINFDKDFTYFRQKSLDDIKAATSEADKKLRTLIKQRDNIAEASNYGLEELSDTINSLLIGSINAAFQAPFVGKYFFEPTIKYAINLLPLRKKHEDIKKTNKQLLEILDTYEQSTKRYINGDFFSLYLSHQSDSVGLVPLAKIAEKQGFSIIHSYCDRGYFENKYIDHITIKVKNTAFSKLKKEKIDKKEFILSVFKTHVYDIVLSKIIDEQRIENNTKEEKEKLLSLFDLVKDNDDNERYNKNDLLKTLSDRNFFGINLLSQLLYTLEVLTGNSMQYHIEPEPHDEKYHFLKELLTMASDPSTTKETDSKDDATFSAKIYFSDGVHLDSSVEELKNDDFIENRYRASKVLNSLDEYASYIHHTADFSLINEDKPQHPELHDVYITETREHTYIKVPIKIVLSLPIDEDAKGNFNLLAPHACSESRKKPKTLKHSERIYESLDILTVGGAEHNRALAHLINKHRLEYKEKRLFGFMDNYIDFQHKIKNLDHKNNLYDDHNFFMGINQPVSGWNYILNSREDDTQGNSANNDIKIIGFRIKSKEDQQNINVLSVYGFSALASVIGTHLTINDILLSPERERVFEGNYSSLLDPENDNNDRGSATTLFLYRTLEDILTNEKSINSPYELIKLKFINFNDQEMKRIKSFRGISPLINSDNPEKIEITIDKNSKLLCKRLDSISKITPKNIPLSIFDILLKDTGGKSYTYLFNHDIDKYKEIFNYAVSNNKRSRRLICKLMHGSTMRKHGNLRN